MEMERLLTEEIKRMQELAGIKADDSIEKDILSEAFDFNATLSKVANYARKGLLTTTLLASLMSSNAFSADEKKEIKKAATPAASTTTNSMVSPRLLDTLKMEEWNQYVDWLKIKGYAGNPKMDNIAFSKQTMIDYKKENPNSSLDYSMVPSVQKQIRMYREWAINMMKQGKIAPIAGMDAQFNNFMSRVLKTEDDGIVGQWTSQFRFPLKFMKQADSGKTINKGFS